MGQNIWRKQDFSRNISIKVLSKYLQLLGSKCHFFNFPKYKSMENLSCHGIQPKKIISIKENLSCHGIQPKEIVFIKNTQFVNVNITNISTKSQPHRANSFRGDIDFNIFSIFTHFAFYGNQ